MSEVPKDYSRARAISSGREPSVPAPKITPAAATPAKPGDAPGKPKATPAATGGEATPSSPTPAGGTKEPEGDKKAADLDPRGQRADTERPNSKGQIVNAGIQALGAAGGNVAGGAAAGAGAGAATAGAGSDAARETGKAMAKDSLQRGGKDAARTAGEQAIRGPQAPGAKPSGEKGGKDSWRGLGKDAAAAAKETTGNRGSSINPLSDDDRSGLTKGRDALKDSTGVDADKAVGAAAGGAAAAAAVATGVGAAGAGAAGAAGNKLGAAASSTAHSLNTKFNSTRKTVTVAFGLVAVLIIAAITGVLSAGSQQQAMNEQQQAMQAAQAQQQAEADASGLSCSVTQEFPIGYFAMPSQRRIIADVRAAADAQGIPMYGQVMAVAVMVGASGISPDPHDDALLGPFGFEPGSGGLTDAELRDTGKSAGLFFERLQAVQSWSATSLADAANQVMASAFPGEYGAYESSARMVLTGDGAEAGQGCEPLGVKLACDPAPEFEDNAGALTPDALNTARCLYNVLHVRGMTASAGGYALRIPLTGALDMETAAGEGSDTFAVRTAFDAADTVAWLSANATTFGIRALAYDDVQVTFVAPSNRNEEGDRYTVDTLRDGTTIADTLLVSVHGTAGTGVLEGGAGGAWVLPVTVSCISSEYGMRLHPTLHRWILHAGMDFPVGSGTNALAVSGGTVSRVFYDSGGGNILEIDYGGGVTMRYLHLSKYLVTEGQAVASGQVVALTGNTGTRTTGAHLHFEVYRDGRSTNPRDFFTNVGVEVPVGCW